MRGPQVLFAMAGEQPVVSREQLGKLQLKRAGNQDWTVEAGQRSVRLRPFADIGEEVYQTYWKVG